MGWNFRHELLKKTQDEEDNCSLPVYVDGSSCANLLTLNQGDNKIVLEPGQLLDLLERLKQVGWL